MSCTLIQISKLTVQALVFVIMSEVGGENGAKRRPPPGIQAQRPSPAPSRRVTTRQINGEREVSKMSARVNWSVRGFSPRHIRGCGPESIE